MPYPLDPEAEAALLAGRLRTADLVDFYVAGTPLRAWTWPGECSYPANDDVSGATPVTYENMHGRMAVPKNLRMAAALSSEALQIILDGSRSGDDEDWVGRFVDSDWHQRSVRVRQILLDFETGAAGAAPIWEWHGRIDHRQLTQQTGAPQAWEVTCQGGLFRVRGRRNHTRSHLDQQRRSAGDMFYVGTANMVGRPLNFAKKPGNIPGAPTGPAPPRGGGGGGAGGGGGGGGTSDGHHDAN